MRVCFISEAKSIHTQRWVRGIAETGHEVHLISSSACNISAIKLHERPLYHANPLKALQNIYAAKKIIKELRPDIVHLFGLYSLNSIFLLPAVYGIKNLVVSPWGTDVVYDGRKESYKSRFIKRLFLGKAKAITSVSRFMTREIRKYLKKNKEIEYIPFGVDIESFHPRYLTNNGSQFTIGITKSLTEKYGHRYLLEAIPAVMAQCPQIS
jgi:L-malate glycosyltransferase